MDDNLLIELRSLARSLDGIAEFFMPHVDAGVFDKFTAFKASSRNGRLLVKGIKEPDPIRLSELKGIDVVIDKLRQNTEQFLGSVPCNNTLLHGPRGTGKSSAVKAIFNRYRTAGLRMIEMPRDTLFHLFEVADLVRQRREHYIIFCDDLSFEEEEKTYRQLKAVLEGGLETKPANMLIYATSNRRHLMPEQWKDNLPVLSDGELQPAETVEEKLSLSDRFGLRLGMLNFDMETYLQIVGNYIRLRKIRVDREELREKAMQWALSHGSYSGRTARQFVDDLQGQMLLCRSK
jgi:hypothetical protein